MRSWAVFFSLTLFVVTTNASAASSSRKASSEEVASDIEVAPLLGFSSDDLNLGLGVRAGRHAFLPELYLGGTFVYQVGHSVTTAMTTPAGSVSAEASVSLFYVGPEGGYDFHVGPVIVRPYAGLGVAWISASASAGGVKFSDTTSKFVIWPGGMVLYDLPDSSFFLGGDLRLLTVPGGPALGIFAFAGTRL